MLGLQNMREQCFLTATVQNIKRLVKASFFILYAFVKQIPLLPSLKTRVLLMV